MVQPRTATLVASIWLRFVPALNHDSASIYANCGHAMETNWKEYFWVWVKTSIVVATAIAAVNVIVDPYLVFSVPRMTGFNARKPAVDTQQQQQLMKAYEVLRKDPATLLLGSSRIALGIDTNSPYWPERDRPVYNLGIPGGDPYMAYRYLQHEMARHRPQLVVMGLEPDHFLNDGPPRPSGLQSRPPPAGFESRLLVAADGSENKDVGWARFVDSFQSVLSLQAINDSLSTLSANISRNSSDVPNGGVWEWSIPRKLSEEVGPYPLFVLSDMSYFRYFATSKSTEYSVDPDVMRVLRDIMELCRGTGTRLAIIVNPSHVYELEVLSMSGMWPALENWKRQLLVLTSQYKAERSESRVELWDFSGYDSFSTETIPKDKQLLHWFIDPAHYGPALGDEIIKRVVGGGDYRFGVLLTPENIEGHLAEIRKQQRMFRERSSEEIRDLRRWQNSVAP
jgi:hypothetical protein